jgi:site-specific recombinase XerD
MKNWPELLTAFLEHERDRRFSPCTLRNHRLQLGRFFRWLEDHDNARTPAELRKAHLDGWLKRLNAHRTTKGMPLKAGSVNLHIAALRTFLAYLTAGGYLPAPLSDALPHVKAPQLLPLGVLTHAQARRLLGHVRTDTPEGYRDRAALELLYSSGLRAGELLGLDVADVDFVHAVATVTGKGRKQRVVPVGKTALRWLESYLKAVRPFLVREPNERALFLEHQGGRLRHHILARVIRAAAGRAALQEQHVTPHTFRRSCATELLRGGANMYHVKELLGHQTLNTLRHYAKLTIVDLKKTHEKCHPREKDEG